MLDHLTHIYLEIFNEVGYLFIAGMFLISFRHSATKKGRNSFLFLVFIFIFCGATRLMMLMGVNPLVHDMAMIMMNFFTWGFIINNKPKEIVDAMQDENIGQGFGSRG